MHLMEGTFFSNFTNYKYRFGHGMPGDNEGLFYSYTIGPIRFIAFTTEFYYNAGYGYETFILEKQYNWIIEELEVCAQHHKTGNILKCLLFSGPMSLQTERPSRGLSCTATGPWSAPPSTFSGTASSGTAGSGWGCQTPTTTQWRSCSCSTMWTSYSGDTPTTMSASCHFMTMTRTLECLRILT